MLVRTEAGWEVRARPQLSPWSHRLIFYNTPSFWRWFAFSYITILTQKKLHSYLVPKTYPAFSFLLSFSTRPVCKTKKNIEQSFVLATGQEYSRPNQWDDRMASRWSLSQFMHSAAVRVSSHSLKRSKCQTLLAPFRCNRKCLTPATLFHGNTEYGHILPFPAN